MWSDPELDFRWGSWGQGRKQKGQEERLDPPAPNPVTKCKGNQILSKGNCWMEGRGRAAKLSLQKKGKLL